LTRPDSGRIRVFGDEIRREARGRIGYLSDELGLYPGLNAKETLQMTGRLFRLSRADTRKRAQEMLEIVGLRDRHHEPIKNYSKGMRQRLGIAVALMNDPELLILDEPYSGLDPIGRRQLRELLLSLKSRGKTIILSSHIVPDVEAVCDRVGILSEGKIQRCLTLKDIYSQKSSPVEVTVTRADSATFEGISGIHTIYENNEALVIRVDSGELTKQVVQKVYALGGDVVEVKPLRFNLEDFLLEALQTASTADTIKVPSAGIKDEEYATSR
ncbi:MAG: ABC transporter ATP-binding protein, partial [bacterium]|nr:ABC transporter ATP-binding protein [bacterium]